MNKSLSFRRIFWFAPPALLALSVFIAVSASGRESCVQLLVERCEVCHYMTRVCQKVDKERKKKSWFGSSEGKWKRIVKNMVEQGAQLTEAEEQVVVQCLSEPADEVLSLCKLDK